MAYFNRFAVVLAALALVVMSLRPARAQEGGADIPSAEASAAVTAVSPLHGNGKYVSTEDGRLYYETEGSGPPLVLVAGGPGRSHASFHPWFSRLAAEHTVIYLDNMGRGRSDRLTDLNRYTVERDADDIEALRKALGYSKISVLGHSYGGLPAIAYALKYGSHVERLILSDAIHCADAWQQGTDSNNFDASTRFPELWATLTAMRASGVKTGSEKYEALYSVCTSDLYWYDPHNAAKMPHNDDKADAVNWDIYHAMCGEEPEWLLGGTMKGYDPRPRMHTIHVPTLVCVGRFDRVALPRIAFDIKHLLPDATSSLVVFKESGHRPWVEEPDRYFQVVGDFLMGKSVEPEGLVAATQ